MSNELSNKLIFLMGDIQETVRECAIQYIASYCV
jgi:hypothetical protein